MMHGFVEPIPIAFFVSIPCNAQFADFSLQTR